MFPKIIKINIKAKDIDNPKIKKILKFFSFIVGYNKSLGLIIFGMNLILIKNSIQLLFNEISRDYKMYFFFN